jgi:glycosyltransferase domain-containing protein
MISKITIVIPTHNRPQYLRRILEYYVNSKYSIIIADSSSKRYDGKIDSHAVYFYYPNTDFEHKINDVLISVKTKYVVFCADDDFLIEDNLIKSVDFLENNNDYACVQGKYLFFYQNIKKYYLKPGYAYKKNIMHESDNIANRLESFMSSYVPLFYAVHHTENIKDLFNKSTSDGLNNPILFELLVSLYMLIAGKYKTLDLLYNVRDLNSLSSDVDRTTYDKIITDEKYKKQVTIFKSILESFMGTITLDKKNNRKVIDNALQKYADSIPINKYSLLIQGIKNFLPNNLINQLRHLYKKISKLFWYKYTDSDIHLDLDGRKQWDKIERILKKHDKI